jgi:ketosteroid isomerase-like protein
MEHLDLLNTRENWYSAFFAGDTDAMAHIEADSFCVVHESGVQSKWEQLHGISRAVLADQWFPTSVRKQDATLSLQNHGEFAVVSGQSHTLIDDERLASVYFSELWRKHAQDWKVMHLHYTPIPDATDALGTTDATDAAA